MKRLLLAATVLFIHSTAFAQSNITVAPDSSARDTNTRFADQAIKFLLTKEDTNYINDRSHDFLVRVYSSTGFNQLKIGGSDGTMVKYKTNDNLNLGLGFNYRFVGFSISFRAPFLNNDDKTYGKTSFLNLSTTAYYRRLTVDLYAQFAHGYYLSNNDVLADQSRANPMLRPDLKTQNIGINAQYIFNYKQFSYRSAFVATEYQKKSAGSFILGGMVYYNHASADSAIVPHNLTDQAFATGNDYNRMGTFCVAANVGYAYTYVFKKHFFATAALAAGGGFQLSSAADGERHNSFGFQTNGVLRTGAGYNSKVYYAAFNYYRYFTRTGLPYYDSYVARQSGSFTFTVGKRFHVKRKIAKKFDNAVQKVEDMSPIH